VSPQTSGGTSYEFANWSDGGAATHEIATPVSDTTYTALFQPAATTTVFTDNFETQLGWTLTPGLNTATTGRWERGDPQGTTSGGAAMQLGTCFGPSVNCLVTGLTSGGAVGANDVDAGMTSIQSPAIALPSSGTITLTFRFYMAHLNNATSADYFRVRVVGANGTAATLFTETGAANTDAASWASGTISLNNYAGQTIRLRFEAADNSTSSLVEAGVDNVTITRQ
jgi:aminopeptidase S